MDLEPVYTWGKMFVDHVSGDDDDVREARAEIKNRFVFLISVCIKCAITHVFEATDIGVGEITSGPTLPQQDGMFHSSNRG